MDLDLLRVPRLIARAIAVTVADYAAMIHAASQTARTAYPRAAARQPADATPPRRRRAPPLGSPRNRLTHNRTKPAAGAIRDGPAPSNRNKEGTTTMEPTPSLEDYRQRKARAREFHPSQWQPAAWPADAIATAQAFHAELANAERGTSVDPTPEHQPRWTSKLFGRSRFCRAAILDGLAVTLLLALMAALGVVAWAASARADTGDAQAYAAEYGPAVCLTLDEYPSYGGFLGIAESITDDGLTVTEAGQAIGMSVADICPRHTDLLTRITLLVGPRTGA